LLQLETWGFPHKGSASDRVALVVAELVSNAVRHGRVPGRDFELRATELEHVIRVDVSDARGEKRPTVETVSGGENGYGMRVVDALTVAWGVSDRGMGKTVWAEIPKGGEV
jgi:anti-sigma regulatory factor (Ser/Thr protein kinase)